ncbi:MAG TPA: glucans biosynthesis glucosyltransferase MdoH [Rhodocyclaceae bacterium]|nr:glucans biosynthesis glucosyltransferase MdoH [Rhodocyclaceae bacterium]
MELHTSTRELMSTDARIDAYLDRLSLTSAQRDKLRTSVAATPEPMTGLHRLLAQTSCSDNPAHASVPRRLALGGIPATPRFAPPLNRRSMVPRPWGTLNPFKRLVERIEAANRRFESGEQAPDERLKSDSRSNRLNNWQRSGRTRRYMLLTLMLAQTTAATWLMQEVLPYHGDKPLEMCTLAVFALLFCWVSSGFWTAIAGFFVQLHGGDRYLISRHPLRKQEHATDIAPEARTAIVMPICNEDVARVFAGLRATYESVVRSGNLENFDFFILSDTSQADTYVAELHAWQTLHDALSADGHLYYRHRHRRIKRKSGNIDDFCRRWGANYRYMVVLDADSVMRGDCLSTLVKLMEANPRAGIIQTAPRAFGRDTFYARMQQFATRVYGELFTAGLHFWQLGEAHYWGHNAIIRLEPFMQHCALAPLPGDGPLDGDILSHDFVEAALMRRAGWGVWIAYDLEGSYEEMPPNLIEELGRDRRWCQGNLMNFRISLAEGIHVMHRAVFITGVMAYLSSPIWLLFLLLSTALLATHTLIPPEYFTQPGQLFPSWPEWHPERAIALFSGTAALLFMPKILSVLLALKRGTRAFGGSLRLTISMLIELVCSMLLAPIRMLFHTYFVIASVLGHTIKWKSPPRADNETGWADALRRHAFGTLLGLAWSTLIYRMSPHNIGWWLPITGALSLSIPVSALSSRATFGVFLRRMKLFLTPEEIAPPRELVDTARYTAANANTAAPNLATAVADPFCNALVTAHAKESNGGRGRSNPDHSLLLLLARSKGPDALSTTEKLDLLDNAQLLSRLHLDIWSAHDVHPAWGVLHMEDKPA